MKTQTTAKYAIVNRFASNAIISTHNSREAAEEKLEKMVRSFRRSNPSTFPTRAIFPHNIIEL